eukprot:COSAG04_NODE_563_length_12569_cov_28.278655_6_plen_67_part_00
MDISGYFCGIYKLVNRACNKPPQFDYDYTMMVAKDPPDQPTRWRPTSRAHFMKRWDKMCTVAHGRY